MEAGAGGGGGGGGGGERARIVAVGAASIHEVIQPLNYKTKK